MAQPKRLLMPMSSHADMGASGIKTGSMVRRGRHPLLRVPGRRVPGRLRFPERRAGTDRPSEHAIALHDRQHRPLPR